MKNRSFSNPAQPRQTTKFSFRAVAGLLLLFALVALAPCPAFANDAPAWMHALTSVPLPPHDEKTDAV
ncbi:MAG TPA: hypothetical protein VFI45_06085, partial [Candidatus Acidoferrum sp.]|nr:hypothetical protein [Candidatus Acidoferrum sp.]